jgi:multidrug efflux pump subunit AcrA (membrane-fusion protein)
MKNNLFTEDSLEAIRSPEQLDKLFTITQPETWMSLLALGMLVVGVIVWSVFGVMSTSVSVAGMLVDPDGLARVYHDSSGKVTEIMVDVGNRVRRGDVVAKISPPALAQDIIMADKGIAESENYAETMRSLANMDAALYRSERETNIKSDYDGIVAELHVNVGEMVDAGATSICSIRLDQRRDDLLAVLYAPLESAKRVRPGMTVRISPSEADTSETGVLIGVVRNVSPYPSSTEGIMRRVGNSTVVGWILAQTNNAAAEVIVDLVKVENAEAGQGYLWSSIVGDRPGLSPGSACTGQIVVERKAPIEKVFLKISQWLRTS